MLFNKRCLDLINKYKKPQSLSRQQGFTLIEIMVVMVILGVLIAAVAPNILGRADESKITVAKSDVRNVGGALDLYKLDNHHYPSSEQGLKALVEKPTGFPEAKNWRRPYLKKEPLDPWGNPYRYLNPGIHTDIDVYSLGADEKEGGEGDGADIGNWDL